MSFNNVLFHRIVNKIIWELISNSAAEQSGAKHSPHDDDRIHRHYIAFNSLGNNKLTQTL